MLCSKCEKPVNELEDHFIREGGSYAEIFHAECLEICADCQGINGRHERASCTE